MQNNRKGFTLIELLLGLSLFSIVSVIIYSLFSSGIRLSGKADGENAVYREVQMAMSLLTEELENMTEYNLANSYFDKTLFEGKSNSIKFLLPTDDGLKVVQYYLLVPESNKINRLVIGQTFKRNVRIKNVNKKEVRKNFLIREEQEFADFLSGNEKDGDLEVICSQVVADGLSIQYEYPTVSEDQSEESSKGLPKKVSVSLEFVMNESGKTKTFLRDVFIPLHRSLSFK